MTRYWRYWDSAFRLYLAVALVVGVISVVKIPFEDALYGPWFLACLGNIAVWFVVAVTVLWIHRPCRIKARR